MPAGVEGFVPARLRMARSARALRKNELAKLVDRAASTVSKWENDAAEQSPEVTVLPLLAEALQVDVSWFFKPVSSTPRAAFFRSLRSELKLMRAKAEAKLEFVEEIEVVVSDYVDLPAVDVPDMFGNRDFRSFDRDDIEHAARLLRDQWELGEDPIDDLLLVIENAGIVVSHDEFGSPKLDGISRWSVNGRPSMLLARDKNVGVRRRFDAAHELGHIVLHRHVSPSDLEQNFKLIENQAMAFAGAFLLPESSFGDDLYAESLDAMLALKSKWKVAIGAMIKRLESMDRISPEYQRRLWQYYSYRGWRGAEPLDDEIAVEEPCNLRASVELIVSEGLASRSEVVRAVGVSANDIENLTGLTGGYLRQPAASIVRLQPVPREKNNLHKEAEVVSLDGRRPR